MTCSLEFFIMAELVRRKINVPYAVQDAAIHRLDDGSLVRVVATHFNNGLGGDHREERHVSEKEVKELEQFKDGGFSLVGLIDIPKSH
jgi:hypothetical protein